MKIDRNTAVLGGTALISAASWLAPRPGATPLRLSMGLGTLALGTSIFLIGRKERETQPTILGLGAGELAGATLMLGGILDIGIAGIAALARR